MLILLIFKLQLRSIQFKLFIFLIAFSTTNPEGAEGSTLRPPD